jgi:hypothetical protein
LRRLRCIDLRGSARLAAAGLAAAVVIGAAAPASASRNTARSAAEPAVSTRRPYVAILWDPATPPGERKLWTAYLYTRAAWLASESGDRPPLGVRAPTFEGEVRARHVAVGLFRQLEAQDPTFGSRYFDDLDRVVAAGFLREYVWRYLKQPSWTPRPAGLHLARFDAWRARHLRYHVPETYGRIAVKLASAAR